MRKRTGKQLVFIEAETLNQVGKEKNDTTAVVEYSTTAQTDDCGTSLKEFLEKKANKN